MSDQLSIGDRWRIVSMRFDQNLSAGRIAFIIGCSRATVFNILRLYHDTDNANEREGRGRSLLNDTNRTSDQIVTLIITDD